MACGVSFSPNEDAAASGGASAAGTPSGQGGSGGGQVGSGGAGAGVGGAGAGVPMTTTATDTVGGNIPLAGFDGTKVSMFCSDLVIAAEGSVIEVRVAVAMTAMFLGDITIKVYSPTESFTTILSMAGVMEEFEGQAIDGDSSELRSFAPIKFWDGAPTDAEDMGVALASAQVACGDDSVCDYAPNSGAAQGNGLSDFVGQDPNGVWEVCFGDIFSNDQDVNGIQVDPYVSGVELTIVTQ
jgi:hypothetical protein